MLQSLLDDYRTLWREPILYWTLAFIALLLLLHFIGAAPAEALQFHREKIHAGEWWRIYTGNLVHFGLYHTNMNCAGFAAVVLILFRDLPWRALVVAMVLVPLGVGMGLLLSQVEIYRGFSGSNYGLLALGLLLGLRHNLRLYALALLILVGKIAMEQMPGYDVNYLLDEIGVAVAVESHLAGFCTGALLGVLTLLWRRCRGLAGEAHHQSH